MRNLTILLALVATAGCMTDAEQRAAADSREAAGEARLAELLGDRVAGEPRTCIPMTPGLDLAKVEGVGLVYYAGNGTRWVNRMNGGCQGLRQDSIIVTRSSLSQYCRGDIVTVTDVFSQVPRGACSFGDFVPYETPADQRR